MSLLDCVFDSTVAIANKNAPVGYYLHYYMSYHKANNSIALD